ncbi:hypothetical protein ACFPM3_19330 [Streptomyces coeruleoprunus]|uniref:Lipoprotein n=1 Tax=Streptomyces coeruleoprunus TaxID=285563 RepID=A0ABV9XJI6_9ACTN
MAPTPVRRAARRAVLAAVGLVVVAGGCADAEGLRAHGARGRLRAPLSLWEDINPSPPPPGEKPGRPARVPVPPVPSGDLRDADALAVVKADVAAAARADRGSGMLVDPRAVRLLAACEGADCPVRPPVHHDLTGDGRAELITAVDIDGRLSELRVYTAAGGAVVRVLSRRAVLEGTEVAAGHLTVREPTSNPQLVSVSEYVWDGREMSLGGLMLDECPALKRSQSPCPRSEQ